MLSDQYLLNPYTRSPPGRSSRFKPITSVASMHTQTPGSKVCHELCHNTFWGTSPIRMRDKAPRLRRPNSLCVLQNPREVWSWLFYHLTGLRLGGGTLKGRKAILERAVFGCPFLRRPPRLVS